VDDVKTESPGIAAPPPRSRAGAIAGGLALLLLVGGIAAVSLQRAQGPRGEKVRTATVEQKPVTSRVLAQGKAKARKQVEVASELSGRVARVDVKVGDVVKQGDPLFSLEDQTYVNAVAQLKTALAAAESMLHRAELSSTEAQKNAERDEGLLQKKVLAEDVVRASRARVELAKADRDQATAGVDRAKLDLERAKEALKKTRVHAPIAGTVVAVGLEVGQVVAPSLGSSSDYSFGLPGASSAGPSPPVVVADLSELIAKLEIDELDVGVLKAGQKVVVTAQGIKDAAFEGIVERVGLMGREQGGAVLFAVDVAVQRTTQPAAKRRADAAASPEAPVPQLELPPPRELLRPGMSVTGEVEVDHLDGALVVPLGAVLEGDGEGGERPDRVFLVVEELGKKVAKEQAVKLGPADQDFVAVSQGLSAGQVVVEGPYRALRALASGDPVVIDEAAGEDAGTRK
jgi:multidrug efflux pump subunit AcrA (membrane-fusion protein)